MKSFGIVAALDLSPLRYHTRFFESHHNIAQKLKIRFVYRTPRRRSVRDDFGIFVVTKACHRSNAMKLIISTSR